MSFLGLPTDVLHEILDKFVYADEEESIQVNNRVVCWYVCRELRDVAGGSTWTAEHMHLFALGGYCSLMRFARDKGCGWSENTCALAAKGGHLTALQWLRDNGCPWDARTYEWANDGRRFRKRNDVYTWVCDHGCPLPQPPERPPWYWTGSSIPRRLDFPSQTSRRLFGVRFPIE